MIRGGIGVKTVGLRRTLARATGDAEAGTDANDDNYSRFSGLQVFAAGRFWSERRGVFEQKIARRCYHSTSQRQKRNPPGNLASAGARRFVPLANLCENIRGPITATLVMRSL
jgi:hypothetical protein